MCSQRQLESSSRNPQMFVGYQMGKDLFGQHVGHPIHTPNQCPERITPQNRLSKMIPPPM
jgi:hypothetical protein